MSRKNNFYFALIIQFIFSFVSLCYRVMAGDKIDPNNMTYYICEICYDRFPQRHFLNLHLEKVHKDYVCIKCKRTFNDNDSLINHNRSSPCKEKYICKFCPKVFNTMEQIKNHTITHEETRKYKCKECLKSFHFKCVLKIHSRIHEDKPFLCDVCDKPFRTEIELKSHIKSHVIMYKCTICKENFNSRTAHLCYADNKPHICSKCKGTFSTKSKLEKHFFLVHGNNTKCKQNNPTRLRPKGKSLLSRKKVSNRGSTSTNETDVLSLKAKSKREAKQLGEKSRTKKVKKTLNKKD